MSLVPQPPPGAPMSFVEMFLQQNYKTKVNSSSRNPSKPPEPFGGKRPVHISRTVVAPRRKILATEVSNANHRSDTVAGNYGTKRVGGRSAHGNYSPSAHQQDRQHSDAPQQHRSWRDKDEDTLDERESELLEVFKHRKEKYQEAVVKANMILGRLSEATEFTPRDVRLHMKETVDEEGNSKGPIPSYSVKTKGHEVTVLTDPVEDPFLLDDVDEDEQVELSELMKQRELYKKYLHKKEEDERKKEAEERKKLSETTTDVAFLSSTSTGSFKLGAKRGSTKIASPTNKRKPVSFSTAEASEGVMNGEFEPGVTEGEDGQFVFTSHPSEVARKRRIIRKLWMGNTIHLKDLYHSKAGGNHNPLDGNNDRSSAPPLASMDFGDDGGDESDLVGAVYAPLPTSVSPEPSQSPTGGNASPTNDATIKRSTFDNRPIPPVPNFTSRSLAFIAETICRDMIGITTSTENILRAAMSTHVRRAGTMEMDLKKCGFLARKSLLWCEGARSQANAYETGDSIVSGGVTAEIQIQRKLLLETHEEIAASHRHLDEGRGENEELREKLEEMRKRILVSSVAMDHSAAVDMDTRDGSTKDILFRILEMLRNCSLELKNKAATKKKILTAPGVIPPSAMELCQIESSVLKIMDVVAKKRKDMPKMTLMSVARKIQTGTMAIKGVTGREGDEETLQSVESLLKR